MKFDKPSLTNKAHIDLLSKRGLRIEDPDKALRCIEFIGYFRLSGYFHYFLQDDKKEHIFKAETSFDDVINIYSFDRKLRALLLLQLEKVEVAFRAVISDSMSEIDGAHWYMDGRHFHDSKFFSHSRFMQDISTEVDRKKKTTFVKHYLEKYDTPKLPPSWMVFELVSFGLVVTLYKHLNARLKKHICKRFQLPPYILANWMENCNSLRNMCAHHERVWNAKFIKKPSFKSVANITDLDIPSEKKLYAQLFMLQKLLDVIHPDASFKKELKDLLECYSSIPTKDMGFPENWKHEEVWN